MPSKTERFDANGNLIARQWFDDNGQPITAQQATTLGTNEAAVLAAIAQAIVDMQAIIDTADIPAGTLTAAQLSNFIRTAQSQLKTTALRVKQAARLLNGDFSSSS